MPKTPWKKTDKQRVKRLIKKIAGNGTLSALADKLGLEHRSVLTNWLNRGQVPVDHIPKLLALAPATLVIQASWLHPNGHLLEKKA